MRKKQIDFAKEVKESLDEIAEIFYRDSLTAQAHFKLGVLSQFVYNTIQYLEEEEG